MGSEVCIRGRFRFGDFRRAARFWFGELSVRGGAHGCGFGLEIYSRAQGPWMVLRFGDFRPCPLYTSDAADDMQLAELGGRRIIKKKNTHTNNHSTRS